MADLKEMEQRLNDALAKIETMGKALESAQAKIAASAGPATRYYDSKGAPQKFWTRVPRYVNGKYVQADPQHPALITFPAHMKIAVRDDGKTPVDGNLLPYTEKPPVEALKKPFAETRRGPKDRGDEGDTGGRPSDIDPAGR